MKRKRDAIDIHDHKMALQWPEPPCGFLTKVDYKTKELSMDRIVSRGEIVFKNPNGSTFEFRFFRLTLPRLVDTLHSCLDTMPLDLVRIIADYYGDVIRLLGAYCKSYVPNLCSLQYGYDTIEFETDDCKTLVCDHPRIHNANGLRVNLEHVVQNPEEENTLMPRMQGSTDISTSMLVREYIDSSDLTFGRVREHTDFTRIVRDIRQNKYII